MSERKRSLGVDVGAAALAATCVVTVTNPMEVVKTRLQLDDVSHNHQPRTPTTSALSSLNPVAYLFRIARAEGWRGVQAGLAAGILYQQAMNGVRLGAYDVVRGAIPAWLVPSDTLRSAVAGASTGVAGAFVASPFFRIKVRLQCRQESHLIHGFGRIVREEGLLPGLFRGANAAMLRVAVGSAAQLSSYDSAKKGIKRVFRVDKDEGVVTHLAASAVASLFVVAVMNPFDTVSTRIYHAQKGVYRGIFHCFRVAVQTEGLRGLYRGAAAHYLRIGPHTVLTLTVWEQFKRLADRLLPRPGDIRSP